MRQFERADCRDASDAEAGTGGRDGSSGIRVNRDESGGAATAGDVLPALTQRRTLARAAQARASRRSRRDHEVVCEGSPGSGIRRHRHRRGRLAHASHRAMPHRSTRAMASRATRARHSASLHRAGGTERPRWAPSTGGKRRQDLPYRPSRGAHSRTSPVSGNPSEIPSDRPVSEVAPSERDRHLPLDFDIDAFLGAQDQAADDERCDSRGWRRKLSGSGIPRSTVDIVFSVAISLLKKASGAALMVFLVVFLVFGPNAPWGQLKWNILRGGPDDASLAQCSEIGEWFSLFDQHTDRLYRLFEDAGPPASWDAATLTRVADLVPRYMDDWLAEMQNNDPPPAGRQLNALFISFLENYGGYVLAIQEGDLEAQKYYERENSIILVGIDIESRHLSNLCI